MDAAAEQAMTTDRRQIPPEIVEIILMHLPITSLLRFSTVSKPWKSLISEPNFTKKRAAVRDTRRLLMSPRYDLDLVLANVSSCSMSSISSDSAVDDETPIKFPVEGRAILRASCGELCCVEANNLLYLWNPSINTYKRLPAPTLPLHRPEEWHVCNIFNGFLYMYGLGYDSVGDDYKIFRLQSRFPRDHKTELYSLRSDSWRVIDHLPFSGREFEDNKCVFVGGALHWSTSETIISFDLATEKYGNVAPPPSDQELPPGETKLSALSGKLGLHSCCTGRFGFHFVMWVMEEKSWTKILDIKNCYGIPLDPEYGLMFRQFRPIAVTPLYLFDNGEILFRVYSHEWGHALFMYKGEERRPWKMICGGISDGFVYDESLFSPLKFGKLN